MLADRSTRFGNASAGRVAKPDRFCLDAYFEELDDRFEAGFDPERSISADADELTEPEGLLLLARLYGEPVGCGAVKLHDGESAELKRMWVDPSARGLGLGRRLLAELEEQARRHGVTTVRLETNRTLTEAIDLYRSAGYEEVEPFNDEPYAHHWFEKRLEADASGGSQIQNMVRRRPERLVGRMPGSFRWSLHRDQRSE